VRWNFPTRRILRIRFLCPSNCTLLAPRLQSWRLEEFRKEYDKHKFTGTVTNNGTEPCGVQLKVSTYDRNGEVIETADFWPASIRNIEPGARENFWYFVRHDKAAKTYDAVVIDAKGWLRRSSSKTLGVRFPHD
jgi:hypothetical protein